MKTKTNKKHLNKNTRKFKNLKCAPTKKKTFNDYEYTCFNNKILFKLKENWNNNFPNKISTNSPKEIWEFFKNNLNTKCYNELCWIKDNILSKNLDKEEIKRNNFRPFSPDSWKKKPYEWLSSDDITKVMKQYTKNYKNFEFLGPSPIDFDKKELYGTCIYEKLCKFNLSNYYNSKPRITKIGIIFNLDPHDRPGSHWVSLFIDIKNEFIFYFDSNGVKIPHQINNLVKRIIEQANSLGIKLNYYSNFGKEHQKKDGQCGIYALYFIIELLKENKDYTYFKDNRIPDEKMKDYRIKYYNTNY